MTIPDGWKLKKLGEIADVARGKFSVRPRNDPRYYGGDIPFVQTGDVTASRKFLRQFSQTLNQDGLSVSKLFPKNTILMTIAANIGDITINQYDVAFPDSVVGINAKKEKSNYLWLYYYLGTCKDYLDSRATQNAQKNINLEVLRPLIIPVPPLPEQIKIADILSTWDKAIEVQEKLITNSETLKKALMQQLLTGKKRLKGFSGKWEEVRLGAVGDISSAGVDKKTIDGETKVRLLNFVDVFRREKIFNHELIQEVTAPKDKINKCNVKKGDIFFTPSSETREELAMSSVSYEDMEDVVYSYHIVRFRLKQKWDMNFCSFIFQTELFRKQVYRLGDGSGQRYVISQNGFRNIKIKIPCLDEQIAIGNILNTASETIIIQKQKLSLLKQEKSALMQDLLTGKRRVVV